MIDFSKPIKLGGGQGTEHWACVAPPMNQKLLHNRRLVIITDMEDGTQLLYAVDHDGYSYPVTVDVSCPGPTFENAPVKCIPLTVFAGLFPTGSQGCTGCVNLSPPANEAPVMVKLDISVNADGTDLVVKHSVSTNTQPKV